MADGQAAVGRHVARTEARPAERGAQHHARLHQIRRRAVLHQLNELRLGGGIKAHRERAGADALTAHNVGHGHDIFKRAAGTACDHALLDVDLTILHLIAEIRHGIFRVHHLARFRLGLFEQFLGVFAELADRVGVGGMEGQRDHRLDSGKIDLHQPVVHRALLRVQRRIFLRAQMGFIPALHLLVGLPDRGKAGGFGRHDVDAVAVFDGEVGNAFANEFHDLVLDKAAGEHLFDDGQRHILRADALLRLAGQVDRHHIGIGDIIGLFAQLLDQLGAALAHAHGAQRTVARM